MFNLMHHENERFWQQNHEFCRDQKNDICCPLVRNGCDV